MPITNICKIIASNANFILPPILNLSTFFSLHDNNVPIIIAEAIKKIGLENTINNICFFHPATITRNNTPEIKLITGYANKKLKVHVCTTYNDGSLGLLFIIKRS